MAKPENFFTGIMTTLVIVRPMAMLPMSKSLESTIHRENENNLLLLPHQKSVEIHVLTAHIPRAVGLQAPQTDMKRDMKTTVNTFVTRTAILVIGKVYGVFVVSHARNIRIGLQLTPITIQNDSQRIQTVKLVVIAHVE